MRFSALLPVSVLLTLPSVSSAEVVAHSTACGPEVRLERAGSGPVTLVGAGEPIPLGAGEATLEAVPMGHTTVLVATVQASGEPVASAVLHCRAPATPEVLWSGSTARQGEDVGTHTRDEVMIQRGAGEPRVIVGRRDERLAIVDGVWPLTLARTVDPATGRLVPHVLDPLTEPGVHLPTGHAVRAIAGPAQPAVDPVLVWGAAVGTGEVAVPGVLADRRAETALPMPRGAVAVATVRADGLSVRGIDLVAHPGTPLPRRVSVFTEPGSLRWDAEIPADLAHAPRVEIPLPHDAHVNRIVLVAGEGLPNAQIADIEFRTELDDPGVDPLARLVALASQPSGDDAVALLIGLGEPGVTALLHALPEWHGVAARRAVRMLGPVHLPGVAEVLVAAMSNRDLALTALASLRQQDERALGPLSAIVTSEPRAIDAIRMVNAPVVAKLHAIVPVFDADGHVWRAAHTAVSGLVRMAETQGQWQAWLSTLPDAPRAASRALALSATEFTSVEAKAAVAAHARELWAHTQDFADRYRLLVALGGDAEGRTLLAQVATGDHDIDLRAEATRVLGTSEGNDAVLLQVLSDRAPRVRAAAATALHGGASTRAALSTALANDPWPTVRAAAAGSLAGDHEASRALLDATEQPSVAVVEAALRALGAQPVAADGVSARLVAFVNDTRRNPDLRREAANAIGARCDATVSANVEHIVDSLSDPALPPNEQEVGHAAMAALARIDPERARAFLHRAGSNAQAVAAVEAAIREGCHPSPTPSGNP